MKKRNINLDIIRTIAIFFVISVHFFLNTPFYTKILHSRIDIVLLFIRYIFFTCVPLFLLLTGYLQDREEVNKKHYLKLTKIIVSYLIIGLICLSFKRHYLNDEFTQIEAIMQIFNFNADKYSWYVNMYIGLFLMIPFLNKMINPLSKKEHAHLILILIIISSLPYTFNNFLVNGNMLNTFPSWWQTVYPLLYYVLGRYFKKYKIKSSKPKLTIILLIVLLSETLLIYFYSYERAFEQLYLNSYSNLFTVIISSTLFLLILNTKFKTQNKLIENISKVSFEMYLLSYIFDTVIYQNIPLKFINGYSYIINYFIYVPLVFISSYLSALIINFISSKLSILINKIIKKKPKKLLVELLIILTLIGISILFKRQNNNAFIKKSTLKPRYNIENKIQDVKYKNKVIIIGDSRMTLILENQKYLNIPINFSFIALSGARIYWIKGQAVQSLIEMLDNRNHSVKYHVVLNMGVNDLNDNLTAIYHAVEYKELYTYLTNKYPDVKFYTLSVNPINEITIENKWPGQKRTNQKIERFNSYIHYSVKDAKYCDSNSSINFGMIDGLHYTNETNRKILNYIVNDCLEYE